MRVMGIDEVGRGCLAGPLVAGAVILEKPIMGLKDSKLLSPARRLAFDAVIRQRAVAYGLGWVSAAEIDQFGLTIAVRIAMQRAVEQCGDNYDQLIIDGNYNFLADNRLARTMIKADNLIPAVSAASIIAKVARDNYMFEMAGKYPVYGFEKHVGYGTQIHRDNLRSYGPCELHRRSFKPLSNNTF